MLSPEFLNQNFIVYLVNETWLFVVSHGQLTRYNKWRKMLEKHTRSYTGILSKQHVVMCQFCAQMLQNITWFQDLLNCCSNTPWHNLAYLKSEGYFRIVFLSFFCFLAFRPLGFLASRLLCFFAFCWFARLLVAFWLWLFAFSAFPVPLRQVAFWLLRLFGLCGFWGLWLFAPSAFTVPLWAFLLLHPFIGFWIWLPASSASIVPTSSNIMGGNAPPPNPPATV